MSEQRGASKRSEQKEGAKGQKDRRKGENKRSEYKIRREENEEEEGGGGGG